MSSSSVTQLVDWMQVDDVVAPDLGPRWNVAPGRELYVVAGTRAGARRLGAMRWGLVPSWSSDPSSGPRPINARAESLRERPAFSDLVRRRRCLVPVDGFYEWKRLPTGRQPWFLSADGGGPLVLAGLWDRWVSADGEPLVTVTIVTVAANEEVARLHDRMPAVLATEAGRARWLDPLVVDAEGVLPLLRPAEAGYLRLHPVGTRVNSVADDDADLVAEVAEAEEPASLF